jgi:hypothetical protein
MESAFKYQISLNVGGQREEPFAALDESSVVVAGPISGDR